MKYQDKELDETWIDLDEIGTPWWVLVPMVVVALLGQFVAWPLLSAWLHPAPSVAAAESRYPFECSANLQDYGWVHFPCRR